MAVAEHFSRTQGPDPRLGLPEDYGLSSSLSEQLRSGKLRIAIVAPSLQYVGGQSVQADLLLQHWEHDPDVQASFIPVDPLFPAGLQWAMRIPGLRPIVGTPFS